MKHKLSFIFFFLIILLPSFARTGLLSGQGKIKYLQTEWFDIIYPIGSQKTAAILSLNADKIYSEICQEMGVQPYFRLPVVITTATDVYNAWFTNSFYNHIVLLDTVSEESMAVFSDSILSTFRHEMTHAVTVNCRNDFWKAFDSIMGDSYNWGWWVVVTSFMAEGAAVAGEGERGDERAGEGRLCDPYYLHLVRQAKISNAFPSWKDVTGARDSYPGGTDAYSFGGPFTAFLQERYGMQKYTEFWYRAVNNIFTLTFWGAFKKVYGFDVKIAWEEFKENLYIPQVSHSDPLEEEYIEDFFGNQRGHESASRYSSLTSAKDAVAYIEKSSNSVWMAKKSSAGEMQKPKKLFSHRSINRISLSPDSRLLALSTYDFNHTALKNCIKIYDTKTGHFFALKDTGLRDASITVDNDGTYYAVAVKTLSQEVSLVAYKINFGKKDIKNVTLVRSLPLKWGDVAFSLVGIDGGGFAFIYKTALEWSIRVYNDFCSEDRVGDFRDYPLPYSDIRLKSLSAVALEDDRLTLSFSWASIDTLPRFGELDLDLSTGESIYRMQRSDVSGGVFYPVLWGGDVLYSASFYNGSKLLLLKKDLLPLEQSTCTFLPINYYDDGSLSAFENGLTEEENEVLLSARDYKGIYYKKGTVLPVAKVPYMNINDFTPDEVLLGLSWGTQTPWDSDFFVAGVGYDVLSNMGGLSLNFIGSSRGGNTSVYSYDATVGAVFDFTGFKQASSSLSLSSVWRLGAISSVGIYDTVNVGLGRRIFYEEGDIFDALGYDDTNYFCTNNALSLLYSNVHAVGSGFYEYFGFKTIIEYDIEYFNILGQAKSHNYFEEYNLPLKDYAFYQNLSPSLQVYLPKLIPIECAYSLTYNLPLTLGVALYADSKTFLSAKAETVLFSVDIQRGLSFIPLFINRLALSLSYGATWNSINESFAIFDLADNIKDIYSMNFTDFLESKILLTSGLNTGILTGNALSLGLQMRYYIHSKDRASPFALSLASSLMF